MITYRLNNYQLGAYLKCAPTHKIIEKKRIDRSHTLVTFYGLERSEILLCLKLFGAPQYMSRMEV